MPLMQEEQVVDAHRAEGARGVVVAESELVARAGSGILQQGGNAYDAAAAACLACSMVHPDKCAGDRTDDQLVQLGRSGPSPGSPSVLLLVQCVRGRHLASRAQHLSHRPCACVVSPASA